MSKVKYRPKYEKLIPCYDVPTAAIDGHIIKTKRPPHVPIASLYTGGNAQSKESQRAYAQLFAAAPELVKTLDAQWEWHANRAEALWEGQREANAEGEKRAELEFGRKAVEHLKQMNAILTALKAAGSVGRKELPTAMAEKEIPDPKGWAKLNADGTPRATKQPLAKSAKGAKKAKAHKPKHKPTSKTKAKQPDILADGAELQEDGSVKIKGKKRRKAAK